ncbi:condensin subunit YCS4 [Ascoidea rubescens DSM 1968]|uniref:ARM repeat-containing protein n=1 Tax=Ascoidea rubescens DSM 1968 TaxID=1344418 RepID=A0A1D2VAF4_9ASCO|nr:ARM repeat-containing protein [Ascoidea rubescens DSM 1968]ODV58652.1 ARM repeat-containing protein [Ascoidea rubescens DSM 1968]
MVYTLKVYNDAIKFIEAIQKGTEIISKLLYSKNRMEVLEAMNFFVLTDAYGIENSNLGIKKMLHLIWMGGSNDEGNSISNHLVNSYNTLFLTTPEKISTLEKNAFIAKNLIKLTYDTSMADLASLEKLLCAMYEKDFINESVVNILWQIYTFKEKDFSKKQRCGAIIVIGMISFIDSEIAVKGIDALLKVGLGKKGREDLMLAKYSCIALQRIVPMSKIEKNERNRAMRKNKLLDVNKENEALERLSKMIYLYNEDAEWFSVAEQAINAIYCITSNANTTCSEIIKKKIRAVFENPKEEEKQVIGLSQLLFIVGHISIKTIVHLEKCEAIFKKRKIELEMENAKSKKKNKNSAEDDLEMIGATTEDDFTEVINEVRENELLYGTSSILARFGPLVKEICSKEEKYQDKMLQRSAVLCMCKFMCVSKRYCEDNLDLLVYIMENSPDPVIRSNAVLSLGDMAVCFNNLVDEKTDNLYGCLLDKDLMVQKTCMMTVTFLILAGQVKVKGQLSQMAKCLENSDPAISDMCRMFFQELATKDNAIYNGFIDIFSGLSNDKEIERDSLKRILRFLIAFITKEKQQKQLADKLVQRLSRAESEEEWKNVAFVLQTLPVKSDQISEALAAKYKSMAAR